MIVPEALVLALSFAHNGAILKACLIRSIRWKHWNGVKQSFRCHFKSPSLLGGPLDESLPVGMRYTCTWKQVYNSNRFKIREWWDRIHFIFVRTLSSKLRSFNRLKRSKQRQRAQVTLLFLSCFLLEWWHNVILNSFQKLRRHADKLRPE